MWIGTFILSAFSWMLTAPLTTFFSFSMASASSLMAFFRLLARLSEAPMWFCRSKASSCVCTSTASLSVSCRAHNPCKKV